MIAAVNTEARPARHKVQPQQASGVREHLQHAIAILGGAEALARAIGVSADFITRAQDGGTVLADVADAIEHATGGKVKACDLRPNDVRRAAGPNYASMSLGELIMHAAIEHRVAPDELRMALDKRGAPLGLADLDCMGGINWWRLRHGLDGYPSEEARGHGYADDLVACLEANPIEDGQCMIGAVIAAMVRQGQFGAVEIGFVERLGERLARPPLPATYPAQDGCELANIARADMRFGDLREFADRREGETRGTNTTRPSGVACDVHYEHARNEIDDRVDDLRDYAMMLRPGSFAGAAYLLGLVGAQLDLMLSGVDAIRRFEQRRLERALHSVIAMLLEAADLDRTDVGIDHLLTTPPQATIAELEAEFDGRPVSDERLIGLGVELREAYAVEKVEIEASETDEELAAATKRTAEICTEILTLPAQTVEGLKVKALAIEVSQAGFDGVGGETTDVRLATSLIGDLLDMGGRA